MRITAHEKSLLLKFFQSQKLLTLAVSSENKPWVSILYYAVDDNFNFYVFTGKETEHIKIIQSNLYIACTIFDSHQKGSESKVGVQFQGTIQKISNPAKLASALKRWHQVNPGFEHIINMQNITKKLINGRMFEIIPTRIKFYNEELYGDDEFKEFQ